jgi:multisubunit Na+/H+ antiporter MnhB subunit
MGAMRFLMRMRGLNRLARGATQLGFMDILTAAILLGILLYAATMQFSVYNRPPAATPTGTAPDH